MKRLRNFISPPPGSHFPRRALPFFVGGGLFFIALLLALPPAWEYSNSAAFCGTTCHTMPPQYKTYLASPHARVPCVDCHIGRDLLLVQFFRKSGHMRLIAATILNSYDYPIKVSEMRPARETCELCHSPEQFADDSLRVITHYDNNRQNEQYNVYLLMHTGGGTKRTGLGKGIHWHIENKISYIATDSSEQEIPWIRVQTADGKTTDYNAINSPVDTKNLQKYTVREMDCITCHNRISHQIEAPAVTVDQSISRGLLSAKIPFIRTRAISLLSASYASSEDAERAISSLTQYYKDNYPDFYATGADQVKQAVATLNDVWSQNNYPEQLLDWKTHPSNVGHLNSAGCFRCHDGQHLSQDGQLIRLECNLCHSIPQVVRPGKIEPLLPLTTGLEPQTHLDSGWITKHRTAFDASCANCHNVKNPGGTDDSSFCSNSQCHGVQWRYAGFDAPGLATVLGIYQVQPEPLLEKFTGKVTYQVLQPLFQQQCSACHGPVPTKGLKLIEYAGIMTGSTSGPVIVPGDPDNSKIIEVLSKGHFAKFTVHQMELLKQWIADKAPEK